MSDDETRVAPLDEWLPSFTVRERHERALSCAPEEALALALALPVAPDRIVRTLFRLRGIAVRSETLGEFTSTNGFLALERTPTSYVFGLAARLRGRPRRAGDAAAWLAWRGSGVKIVADLRAEPIGNARTRLTTETRVLALDRRSWLLFRAYWLVVRPFSALIRRRWLRAIAARAEARLRATGARLS